MRQIVTCSWQHKTFTLPVLGKVDVEIAGGTRYAEWGATLLKCQPKYGFVLTIGLGHTSIEIAKHIEVDDVW